jgi:hypothetical protein
MACFGVKLLVDRYLPLLGALVFAWPKRVFGPLLKPFLALGTSLPQAL